MSLRTCLVLRTDMVDKPNGQRHKRRFNCHKVMVVVIYVEDLILKSAVKLHKLGRKLKQTLNK